MTSFNSGPPQGFPNANMPVVPPGYSMGDLPEEPKKKKKRRKIKVQERALDISINSLLDILSVLLVFLMKSYSTTTVQIKPSKELQVPFSWASGMVEDTTSITITLKNILLDDKPIISFSDGKIPEQELSEGNLRIDKLFEKIQDEVSHLKKIEARNSRAKFRGIVTVIADRYVPFPLLAQVMYTAGQAEFGQFKFALIRTER
ncbi:MAG: biopolymer transporter ExbD [Deltaproteobacteria bacterium]|nr:biopolymer transporter ExbD [Deltaproteobacteria bacterium]